MVEGDLGRIMGGGGVPVLILMLFGQQAVVQLRVCLFIDAYSSDCLYERIFLYVGYSVKKL